ncbi:MAG TPA: GMC family oxidoreductase [Chloroflexota bacterium]|nr:GMC family oxidoreductase [Chloroflexota bacterium]
MDTEHLADVLVIGAGASGAVVSWRLGTAGFRVVCLEQGGWIPLNEIPTSRPDWEVHRYTDFSADPNVRKRPEDYPVENSESDIAPLMFNAVGGSTIHWTQHFPRFHPSDFRVRSLDGVADDWPLTYAELEPYYDWNDREIGVSGLAGDPAYPPKPTRPTPPIALGDYGATLGAGFDKLGWHWWVSDTAAISEPYGDDSNRLPCNHCGPCDLGCSRGARSSADVTYWPRAIRAGVKLVTHARVREITVDARGLADGALYYDRDGKLRRQRAPIVIIACNGIGTPRLLLNSRSQKFPDGLANRTGLVGKNLMFHSFAAVTGVFDGPIGAAGGGIGSSLFSHEFYETDERRGFVRGVMLQGVRQSGPLHTALGAFVGQRVPWGADHHRVMRERYEHIANFGVMGEDLPEEANQVTLDPVLTDADGIPAPRVRYRLSENSQQQLAFGTARAKEAIEAAGAHTVLITNPLRGSGWHLMGTARMGDDPARSVVDRWGRAHDVPNLYIVDGSVFVTSAAVNPTTTIQALALRTADHITRGRGYNV